MFTILKQLSEVFLIRLTFVTTSIDDMKLELHSDAIAISGGKLELRVVERTKFTCCKIGGASIQLALIYLCSLAQNSKNKYLIIKEEPKYI